MAAKKKDNPIALGVMGVILVGALYFVGKSLFSGDPQQQAHPAAAAAAADSQPSGASTTVGGIPESTHDPFSSPKLEAASVKTPGSGLNLGGMTPDTVRGPRGKLPTWGDPVAPPLTPLNPNVRVRPMTRPGEIDPAFMAAEEERFAKQIRVTAIVMGARPYAVLEPIGHTPRTLHASEQIKTLRLVVIRAGEIVLKGQTGLWTLPLATPETENAPGDRRKIE